MAGMIPTARGAYLPASPIAALTDTSTGKVALSVGSSVVNVGDTGMRDISASLSTRTEGSAKIRRAGDMVTFTMDVAKFSNTGTFTLAGAIPAGFRPASVFNGFAVQLTGTDGWRVAMSTGGNLSLYTYTGGWVRFNFIYQTADPWPTTLPGV